MGMPAIKHITRKMGMYTLAVPRSGCRRISIRGTPMMHREVMNRFLGETLSVRSKYQARKKM